MLQINEMYGYKKTSRVGEVFNINFGSIRKRNLHQQIHHLLEHLQILKSI